MEIVKKLVTKLTELKLTISTCESATCGYIAALFGSVPGVSQVYKGGLVTYSNASKVILAGIEPEVINKHGAVSEQAAEAMALNVAKVLDTHIGISVTGNAGPNCMEDKPEGMFYIGINILGNTNSHQIVFPKKCDRKTYIEKTAKQTLELLYKILSLTDKK